MSDQPSFEKDWIRSFVIFICISRKNFDFQQFQRVVLTYACKMLKLQWRHIFQILQSPTLRHRWLIQILLLHRLIGSVQLYTKDLIKRTTDGGQGGFLPSPPPRGRPRPAKNSMFLDFLGKILSFLLFFRQKVGSYPHTHVLVQKELFSRCKNSEKRTLFWQHRW